MIIRIKKIKGTENEYFAYTQAMNKKASFLLYFTDTIHGGIMLCTFVDMLRKQYNPVKLNLSLEEHELEMRNPYILELLRKEQKSE